MTTKGHNTTKGQKRRRDPAGVDALNSQQEHFCQRYAGHRNAAQAYAEAYPKSKKSTAQYRAEMGSRMLVHPKICARIEQLTAKFAEIAEKKFEVTSQRVLEELAKIAFSNSADYFDWGTNKVVRRRKNKETGTYDPMLDETGAPIEYDVPYARLKPAAALDRDQTAAIVAVSETISRTGERVIEAKMADKLGALKLIGQHLGMFKELREVTGKNGGPIQQQVSLPDMTGVKDPVAAMKAFEQLRTTLYTAGNA